MRETNGEGAGCSAAAGQDRRESDVMHYTWGWRCLKEICPNARRGGQQDEERVLKKGEDLNGVQPAQWEDER